MRAPDPCGHPTTEKALDARQNMPDAAGAFSLDRTTKTLRARAYYQWLRRRRARRMYHRAMSGLRLGGNLRFITLTTSLEAVAAGKDIRRSFRALVMRLRRRNLCSGYVKVLEFTRAGLPHLHIIMRGPPIPQWWLSEVWAAVHLSPIVDVRAVRGKAGAAGYLAKYMGKSLESRYSWSWDWVWKGFVKTWHEFLTAMKWAFLPMVEIIRWWEYILDRYRRTGKISAYIG